MKPIPICKDICKNLPRPLPQRGERENPVGAGLTPARPDLALPTPLWRRGWGRSLGAALFLLALPTLASAPDLPNFHPVGPGIWRGAAPSEAGLRQLKAMGIKTVIDLRIAPKTVKKEGLYARSLGLNWINLPMGSDPPTSKEVSTLLATLKQAPASPVFVHCQHGADRTGCMIGIYRVTQQGWSFPQAYAEMRRDGFDPRWGKLKAAVQTRAK